MMNHRLFLKSRVSLLFLSMMVITSSVTAQVVTDLTYDLTTLSEPELLVDWTASGAGSMAGIRVTTTAGQTRTYRHTSLDLDNVAFLMDVVISAQSLGSDTERGARFWAQFSDPWIPPMLVRHAEVRLYRETGTYKVGLFNTDTGGSALVSLSRDWTNTVDRLRVRLRYQEIAGVGTIFLVAENSSQWTPDLAGPMSPGPGNTLSLPVNSGNFPGFSGSREFGFGNAIAGAYYGDYQHVRLITSSDPGTELPVPSEPATPGVPSLAIPGHVLLFVLLGVGGWVFLARPRA